jgi:GNAT superfamily N-acetyltransferase
MSRTGMSTMPTSPIPFTQDHLEPAVELFIENYKHEREQSPLLPPRVIDDPAFIRGALQSTLANPGVVVVEQDRVLSFIITGDRFNWKGQQAAIVLEHGHAAIATNKRELCQRMYMSLAREWASQNIHLHLIRHFAHDTLLQETLYQLGFGAILAERLRDCSAIDGRSGVAVRIEQDVSKLISLQTEHNRYYPQSPIFISKPTEAQKVRAALEAHAQLGDVFFVYYEQDEPCAYMIVGGSAIGGGDGFLLEQTNTAQIKSAFARPEFRGKGIGAALLRGAIAWSRQHGYERVFVEHETANVYGGNFWRTYFTPYLYSSMRYIDNTLDIPANG